MLRSPSLLRFLPTLSSAHKCRYGFSWRNKVGTKHLNKISWMCRYTPVGSKLRTVDLYSRNEAAVSQATGAPFSCFPPTIRFPDPDEKPLTGRAESEFHFTWFVTSFPRILTKCERTTPFSILQHFFYQFSRFSHLISFNKFTRAIRNVVIMLTLQLFIV